MNPVSPDTPVFLLMKYGDSDTMKTRDVMTQL